MASFNLSSALGAFNETLNNPVRDTLLLSISDQLWVEIDAALAAPIRAPTPPIDPALLAQAPVQLAAGSSTLGSNAAPAAQGGPVVVVASAAPTAPLTLAVPAAALPGPVFGLVVPAASAPYVPGSLLAAPAVLAPPSVVAPLPVAAIAGPIIVAAPAAAQPPVGLVAPPGVGQVAAGVFPPGHLFNADTRTVRAWHGLATTVLNSLPLLRELNLNPRPVARRSWNRDTKRGSYRSSAAGQLVGVVRDGARRCRRCADGNGVFTECVVVDGWFGGGCCCCNWISHPEQCSLYGNNDDKGGNGGAGGKPKPGPGTGGAAFGGAVVSAN